MALGIKEINTKYDLNFDDKYVELHYVIVEIFNSDLINPDNYDLSNSKILNILGLYYEGKEKNYSLAIKYFQMAIGLGNSDSMHNLAIYYEETEKNYPLAIKYYLMTIQLGNLECMNRLITLSQIRPIEVFNSINLINEPDEYLINLKNELNKNVEVIIFNNKKRLFKKINYIEKCPICLDPKLNINLKCGHPICIDCYPNITVCYLRCCEL